MRDDEIAKRVRASLRELARIAPGKAIEVRIPPYAAIQCGAGPIHTRGTPPNVIEIGAQTWIDLVSGTVSWEEAINNGDVRASGARANLSAYLPLRGF